MIYHVYVKIDDKRRITRIDSNGFLFDSSGWIKIDEGSGDRYYHAQNSYFAKPLTDDRGVYRYVLDENGRPCELTQEEEEGAEVTE